MIPENYNNSKFYKTRCINYNFHLFIEYYFYKLLKNNKY